MSSSLFPLVTWQMPLRLFKAWRQWCSPLACSDHVIFIDILPLNMGVLPHYHGWLERFPLGSVGVKQVWRALSGWSYGKGLGLWNVVFVPPLWENANHHHQQAAHKLQNLPSFGTQRHAGTCCLEITTLFVINTQVCNGMFCEVPRACQKLKCMSYYYFWFLHKTADFTACHLMLRRLLSLHGYFVTHTGRCCSYQAPSRNKWRTFSCLQKALACYSQSLSKEGELIAN